MTAIVKSDTRSLSHEQVEIIKNTIAKGVSDQELALFVATSNRLGLDPFARQIFAVKRYDGMAGREVMSIQVSIDGFRLVAQRSGEYAGQDGPYWCGEDGVWKDAWLNPREAPVAARVGVYRRGFSAPLYAVARFDAYAQRKKDGGLTGMWAKMGDLMIAKCAEALALRRAFPAELSGVYTSDEMGQANGEESETRALVADVRETTTAASEAQARHKNESEALANEWGPMIDAIKSADDVCRWANYHGWAWNHMHTNARSRVYRVLAAKCKEVGVKKPELDGWLREAPEQTGDEEEVIQ